VTNTQSFKIGTKITKRKTPNYTKINNHRVNRFLGQMKGILTTIKRSG
jgi:hypothetical protein